MENRRGVGVSPSPGRKIKEPSPGKMAWIADACESTDKFRKDPSNIVEICAELVVEFTGAGARTGSDKLGLFATRAIIGAHKSIKRIDRPVQDARPVRMDSAGPWSARLRLVEYFTFNCLNRFWFSKTAASDGVLAPSINGLQFS